LTRLRKNISRDGASSVNEFTERLANRLRVSDADVITADEIKDWPGDKFDELVAAGVLTEIEHAKGVICSESEENCYVEPAVRTYPDGKMVGVYVCCDPDIGRIEVDLDRLRQWRINAPKLEKLGYCVDTGPDPQDEFITVLQASILLDADKGTISRLATDDKIKHNGETGAKRRISKLSILLLKDERENEQIKRDFDEYRDDIKKVPDKH